MGKEIQFTVHPALQSYTQQAISCKFSGIPRQAQVPLKLKADSDD